MYRVEGLGHTVYKGFGLGCSSVLFLEAFIGFW